MTTANGRACALGNGTPMDRARLLVCLEGEERAVTLNPSAPLARHFLACVLEFSGQPADALPSSGRLFFASTRRITSVLSRLLIKAFVHTTAW